MPWSLLFYTFRNWSSCRPPEVGVVTHHCLGKINLPQISADLNAPLISAEILGVANLLQFCANPLFNLRKSAGNLGELR